MRPCHILTPCCFKNMFHIVFLLGFLLEFCMHFLHLIYALHVVHNCIIIYLNHLKILWKNEIMELLNLLCFEIYANLKRISKVCRYNISSPFSITYKLCRLGIGLFYSCLCVSFLFSKQSSLANMSVVKLVL